MLRKIGILLFLFGCISITCLGQGEKYTEAIPGTNFAIDLVKIPAGTFVLGSTSEEEGRGDDETPSAPIKMEAFWMSTYEITYDQYLAFRDKDFDANKSLTNQNYQADAVTRPSPPYLDFTYGMGSRDGFPAVSMTQQAALRYCQWLYQKTGNFYRLPTEAEWEYACKAGAESAHDPDEVEDYAWFFDNSEERYHKVGNKEPNAWGLYDMLGNVAEYTLDQYDADFHQNIDVKSPHKLQTVPKGKYGRVVKGGAYDDEVDACRCAYRLAANPAWQARDPQIPKSIWWNPDSPFAGFRIVRPEGTFTKAEIEAFFKKVIID